MGNKCYSNFKAKSSNKHQLINPHFESLNNIQRKQLENDDGSDQVKHCNEGKVGLFPGYAYFVKRGEKTTNEQGNNKLSGELDGIVGEVEKMGDERRNEGVVEVEEMTGIRKDGEGGRGIEQLEEEIYSPSILKYRTSASLNKRIMQGETFRAIFEAIPSKEGDISVENPASFILEEDEGVPFYFKKRFLRELLENIFDLNNNSYEKFELILNEKAAPHKMKIYYGSYTTEDKNRVNVFRSEFFLPCKAEFFMKFMNDVGEQTKLDTLLDQYFMAERLEEFVKNEGEEATGNGNQGGETEGKEERRVNGGEQEGKIGKDGRNEGNEPAKEGKEAKGGSEVERTAVIYLSYRKTIVSSARDFVYLKHWGEVKRGSKNFFCDISRSIVHPKFPIKKGCIRGDIIYSGHVIEDLADGTSFCKMYSECDFKANIPTFISKSFSKDEMKKYTERCIERIKELSK